MGLHTGEPQVGEERYVGLGVHKAARIGAAGHGGQVLLSRTTRELVEDELPPGVTIRDLGERRLKDVDRPERLSQLVIDGLPSDFGALNTLDVELRRKRRRLYAGAALIGVLAAAVAIPVFALGQGSGPGTVVEPNHVAVIDPESNSVTGSIQVGIRPSPVAVGEGFVWVGNLDDRSLSKIDPSTRTIKGTFGLAPYTPTGVTTGAGAVWLAHGYLGSYSRFDPSVDSVAETIDDVSSRSTAGSAAHGLGAVWFAFGVGEIVKVNPSTSLYTEIGIVGNSTSSVTVGAGWVWVANAGDNSVDQINPRTVSEVDDFSVGGSPRSIAFGAGAVWVANEATDNVTRIDTSSGFTTNIPVGPGSGPTGIAYGAGAVWVANAGAGTVSRIDPTTEGVVDVIPVGNRPAGIAFGEGAVWVTVQEPTEE